jgi:hypothetical protein
LFFIRGGYFYKKKIVARETTFATTFFVASSCGEIVFVSWGVSSTIFPTIGSCVELVRPLDVGSFLEKKKPFLLVPVQQHLFLLPC